ncbi:MAG: DoxX family protein [Chitinophagales bacterium]|nr:DoxX family protein [Chitinophagales bacterium]
MKQLFNTDLSSLVLRLTFGFSMLYGHGISKLQRLIDGNMSFADPFGIGQEVSLFLVVFAEFLCAVLVTVGILTRFTVIPLIITMFTAIFVIHISDPFKDMEMAILYLGGYLAILFIGGGKYSLDRLLPGKR